MRVRFALAMLLTFLTAAPLWAQIPLSTGAVEPGSWGHSPPYSACYGAGCGYGDYWDHVGGGCPGGCGAGGGWFPCGRCTTVDGCPYWESDPCCRTIFSEMACDVKCWMSTMHCSNHSRLRSALCRALCQDCAYGSCSTCGCEGSNPYGYDMKTDGHDSESDPFRDDPPRPQAESVQRSTGEARPTRATRREGEGSSVLRVDYEDELQPKRDVGRLQVPREEETTASSRREPTRAASEPRRAAAPPQQPRQMPVYQAPPAYTMAPAPQQPAYQQPVYQQPVQYAPQLQQPVQYMPQAQVTPQYVQPQVYQQAPQQQYVPQQVVAPQYVPQQQYIPQPPQPAMQPMLPQQYAVQPQYQQVTYQRVAVPQPQQVATTYFGQHTSQVSAAPQIVPLQAAPQPMVAPQQVAPQPVMIPQQAAPAPQLMVPQQQYVPQQTVAPQAIVPPQPAAPPSPYVLQAGDGTPREQAVDPAQFGEAGAVTRRATSRTADTGVSLEILSHSR